MRRSTILQIKLPRERIFYKGSQRPTSNFSHILNWAFSAGR